MNNFYYVPGAGKIKAHRCTISERIKMWKKRRQRGKELMWF